MFTIKIIADLHLHSKYSRACSKQLDIENLEKWARVKGLNLLGTSDFTHPEWIKEIKANLTDDGTGILKTKTGMSFIMQTEVSLIYTDMGKGRRVHNVIFAPSIEIAEQVTEYFLSKGRIDYDGRPIFKIPCVDLAESLMEISDKIEIIPAHCLIPGSLIHTFEGLKKIEKISKKDFVLTHKGRYKKVKKIYKRSFSGEITEIVPACLKEGSFFTPEHPIYSIKTYKSCKNVPHTICKPICAYLKRGCNKKEFEKYKPEWIQVKDLEKGDIILYPRYNKVKDKSSIHLSDFVSGCFKEKGYIKPRRGKTFVKNVPVNNKIEISKEFCRLIGYYLAEGYCVRDYIAFTFSNKEKEYINDVHELLIKIFGSFLKIQIVKEKSEGTTIRVHSKILKEFFEMFYNDLPYRSFNKIIPQWIIDLPQDKLIELIVGWWRGDAGYSSSLNLTNQFKLIFLKLGVIPSIIKISAESVNKRRKIKPNIIGKRKIIAKNDILQFHNLSFFESSNRLLKLPEFKKFKTKLKRRRGWIDQDYIYLPIIKINKKDYNGSVYNLEVDLDNSYLTENLAVHNCWTPWFGLLGSMGGYNSVKDAFKDKVNKIHALETGLSSDPEMNWRLSQLDKFSLISTSDSHSFWPWRIGREATLFDLKELSYNNLIKALRTKEGLSGTIEVDPAYGKYHWDGHRNCDVCLSPKQTKELNGICPKCGKPVTIGVEYRVEELADREMGFRPSDAKDFKRLIPLSEIISSIVGKGVATKTVWAVFDKLIGQFNTELNILLDVSKEELLKVVDAKMVEAILKNRNGQIEVQPGYDGEYGVPLFNGNKPEKKIAVQIPLKKKQGLGKWI